MNALKPHYNPWDYYNQNAELRRVIDQIRDGYFSPESRSVPRTSRDASRERPRQHYCYAPNTPRTSSARGVSARPTAAPMTGTKKSILKRGQHG